MAFIESARRFLQEGTERRRLYQLGEMEPDDLVRHIDDEDYWNRIDREEKLRSSETVLSAEPLQGPIETEMPEGREIRLDGSMAAEDD